MTTSNLPFCNTIFLASIKPHFSVRRRSLHDKNKDWTPNLSWIALTDGEC